jgi:hypothetical protein
MKDIIHCGYMLFMDEISEEDTEILKPYLTYTVKDKWEKWERSITLKRRPYVAMHFTKLGKNKLKGISMELDHWFKQRMNKEFVARLDSIYVNKKKHEVVFQGHIEGRNVNIVASESLWKMPPLMVKKMANEGQFGPKRDLQKRINVRCKAYAFSKNNGLLS